MPWFSKKQSPTAPHDMDVPGLLFESKSANDPVYAHACLQRAKTLEPDNLEVERALLMLGRLHLRSGQAVDYSFIKCYLLHGFEHPEQYSEAQLESAARELFDDPQLNRCLSLSNRPEAFLDGYLDELCAEYMRIFIAGDSSHAPRAFGFSAKTTLHSYLARPASDLISNALQSPFLSTQQQRLVARSIYRAFSHQMGGETKALDKLLGADICRVIA